LQRQDDLDQQRQALGRSLDDIDRQAADLEAEKLSLAAVARQNPQDRETLGRIALADMDLKVLAGVRQRYQSALVELPTMGADRNQQDWLNSVKNAQETALLDTINTLEAVIYQAMARLNELDKGKYNHQIRQLRAVNGRQA